MKGSRRQLAVLTCVGALAVSGVAAAANSGSFLDPAGDAASAPDITGVAVSSDDAGIVTVKVSVANRSALAAGEEVDVGIDTDQNPDTGSVFYGAEYELDLAGALPSVLQARPDGYFKEGVAPSSYHASFGGGVVTYTFSASELGITSGFNLYVQAFDKSAIDEAPDIRTVNYQLVNGTTAPTLGPDQRAPLVEALKSRGVHGTVAELNYFAADGRGETSDSIVVYRGKKALARVTFRLQDTSPFLSYFARWKVPKSIRGKLRFCVTSKDRAGNKSNTSCAALIIS